MFSAFFEAVAGFCGAALDVLAGPATTFLDRVGPESAAVDFILAFIVTALFLSVAAVLLSMLLRGLAWAIRTPMVKVMAGHGGLARIRQSTQGLHSLHQLVLRLRAMVGVRFYYGNPDAPDRFNKFPTAKRFHALLARTLQGVVSGVGAAAGSVSAAAASFQSWKFALAVSTVAAWAVWRPGADAWSPLLETTRDFAQANMGTVLVAWIPGLAILAALFSSAQLRGRRSWRTRRFDEAHAAFDILSEEARKSAASLQRAVDGLGHFLATTATRDMGGALTAGRCVWNSSTGSLQPRGNNPNGTRGPGGSPVVPAGSSWGWSSNNALAAQLSQLRGDLDSISATYEALGRTGRLEGDIHTIAPFSARLVLFRLWKPPAGDLGVWHRELRDVDIASYEQLATSWLRDHQALQDTFLALGPPGDPGETLLAAANTAVAEIAQQFRSKLADAIWFESELESLVRAGNQIRFPSFFGKMREGAS